MQALRHCLLGTGLLLSIAAGVPDRQMRWAMGTLWEIETPGVAAPAAMAAAFAEIRRLDGLLSHYQPESAISRLNRSGRLQNEPEVAALLARSAAYSQESQGAFDVTVAPLVGLWGFKTMQAHVPTVAEMQAVRPRVGWQKVSITGDAITLPVGTSVELGAIGKGYALDRAMQVLQRHGLRRARIDAGGQQRLLGTWTVAILHPRKDGVLGQVSVTDGSVATSGDTERFFIHQGKRYNHLIDPRTGYPTSDWPSVTVIAPDGESADALSTVAAILGPQAAIPVLNAHQAEALWYGADGRTVLSPGFRWKPETPTSPEPPREESPAP
jgi:thiamine biosynthesis lipoprotein ApbE